MKSLKISLGLFVLFLITFSNRSFSNKISNDNKKGLEDSKNSSKINENIQEKSHGNEIQKPKTDQNKKDYQEQKVEIKQNIHSKENKMTKQKVPEMKFKETTEMSNSSENISEGSHKGKKNNKEKSSKSKKHSKSKSSNNHESNRKEKTIQKETLKPKEDKTEISSFQFTDKNHIENLKKNEKLISNSSQNKKNNLDQIKLQGLESDNFNNFPKKEKQSFTRIKDFFKKTSKSNQNVAWKALAGFICGFILFFGSIHLICWNERRAVRECQYVDFIREETKCRVIENGGKVEKIEENLVYIVNGNIVCEEEPKVEGLDIEFNCNLGVDEKLLMLKTQFEKFSIEEYERKVADVQMENGEEGEEFEKEKRRVWKSCSGENGKLESKVYHGKAYVNSVYEINLKKLEYLIESNQKEDFNLNKYIYIPKDDDKEKLEEYLKEGFNTEMVYIIKDQFIYILKTDDKDNFDEGEFNPETYEFSKSDFRLSIKYYWLKNNTTPITCVGSLKSIEGDKFSINPFDTKISIPGCSYLCCCCAESGSTYNLDEIYLEKLDRSGVAKKLEDLSDTSTWLLRILGFILHFLGVYFILYPFILIIGMIPFLGAIGATILIFFAFIFALMSFLFIIACSWICARPFLAFVIYGFIFILFFVGKTERDMMQENNNQNGNSNYNNTNNSQKQGFKRIENDQGSVGNNHFLKKFY